MSSETMRPMTIVTGASAGIGLELAREFAAAGYDLLLVARNADRLNQAAEGLTATTDITAFPLALDITQPDAPTKIDAALRERNAFAHVLINNAGLGLSGEFASHDEADVEALLQININALTRLTRHVLPDMIKRGRGGILNVASLGGLAPGPYQATYYASKAYVISLSEALAAEIHHSGVRVSVLAPGPVETEFHQRMGSQNDFYYRLLPVVGSARAAKSGYRGFLWRRRVIIPGFTNNVLALFLRYIPHVVTVPIVSFLLRPRR